VFRTEHQVHINVVKAEDKEERVMYKRAKERKKEVRHEKHFNLGEKEHSCL
jgi:hypothetical protein